MHMYCMYYIIIDLKLSTDFIIDSLPDSLGHSWTAKIRADSRSTDNATISLLVYVFNEGEEELMYNLDNNGKMIESISGHVNEVRIEERER